MELPFAKLLRVVRPEADQRLLVRGRRIYVLPTAYGMLFVLLILLLLIGSVNYSNNPAFLLTFLLGGILLVSVFRAWQNLEGLQLQFLPATEVFAGQEASLPLRIEPGRRERPSLQVSFHQHRPMLLDCPAGESRVVQLAVPTERRGWLRPGRLTLESRYPLGLIRAWCYVEAGDLRILVYPAPARFWSAPAAPGYGGTQSGDRGVGTDDFVGHRGYRSGDGLKQLDWKIMARERGLMIKQFGGDRSEQVWLDYDALAPLEREKRIAQLTRGVLDLEYGGGLYGLRMPGLEIGLGRGPAHRAGCLRALALGGTNG